MDPTRRKLLRVDLTNAVDAEEMFTKLMGEEVEPRRQFIEDNALQRAESGTFNFCLRGIFMAESNPSNDLPVINTPLSPPGKKIAKDQRCRMKSRTRFLITRCR